MAIFVTQIDSQSLNSTEGIVLHIERNTSAGDYVATTTKRNRNKLTPVVTNEVFESRVRTIHISPNPAIIDTGDPNEIEDFNSTLHNIFMPWQGRRTLYGIDHNGETYTAPIYVKRFGRRGPHEWAAEFEFITGVWKSETLNTETTSPITVSGNVFAQPILTIEGATAISRNRVTITDRTGHGVMGLIIGFAHASPASDTIVYMNGVSIPFAVSDGRIYFRIAAPPSGSTFIDVFYGSAINNTTTANELDTAGITLNAALVSSAAYTTDPSNPFSKALSSALTWVPGIVTRHPRNRAYTFGFDEENRIRLVDRSATGEQVNLPDDADAYILTSPVEIQSISGLSFDVTSQYISGRNDDAGEDVERVMRVTISTIDGSKMVDAPKLPSNSHVRDVISGSPSTFPAARNEYLFYAQFTFGDITFPYTWSFDTRDQPWNSLMLWSEYLGAYYEGSGVLGGGAGTVWRNDYLPWEIDVLAQQFIGCTVTTGEEGVWYLHFPAGSFRDVEDLPLLSMSLHPKGGEWDFPNNDEGQDDIRIYIEGDTSLDNVLLFESVWVDPDTLEPLDRADPDAPANDESLSGTATAFVAKRTRDSEDWTIVWSETFSATDEDFSDTLTPTGLTGLNAVQVAVGLRPASTHPRTIDAGTLSITTNPIITLNTAKTPTIAQNAGLDAQFINGVFTNETTNQWIRFENVVGGADGLVIDMENLTIAANTGPFYGKITNNDGTRIINLEVGNNVWSSTYGGTTTLQWRNREAS